MKQRKKKLKHSKKNLKTKTLDGLFLDNGYVEPWEGTLVVWADGYLKFAGSNLRKLKKIIDSILGGKNGK